MADLPTYPDTGDAGSTPPEGVPAAGRTRSRRVTWIVIATVAVVVFVVLHLTGVIGPESH
ncbi:MAG: hypothetical protein ABJB47_10845 [Actinomycetota bacterium]